MACPHLDTNPYGLVAFPGGHLVTDAGANALLRVRASGHTSLVAVFQSRGSTPPRPSFAPSARCLRHDRRRRPDVGRPRT